MKLIEKQYAKLGWNLTLEDVNEMLMINKFYFI